MPDDAALTITAASTGSLTANGGEYGAGNGRGGGYMSQNNGNLYIGGGSVNADFSGTAYQTSAAGAPAVYKTVVSELPASSAVACSYNGGANFPCTTDESGKLYLWLPTGDGLALFDVSGVHYRASGTVAASNGNTLAAVNEDYIQSLSALSVTGGSLSPTFDPAVNAYSVNGSGVSSIDITATPSDSKATMLLNGTSLAAGVARSVALSTGENTVTLVVVARDATTRIYTITVTRQTALAITTTSLPVGIVGASYGKTLAATGGSGTYTWTWAAASGSSLPANIELSTDGTLSLINENALTASDIGSYSIEITATDSSDSTVTQTGTFTLTIGEGCGGGAYLIESDGGAAYTGSYTDDGIPTLTVNSGVTGFTYFGVDISAVTGHSRTETCVFIQLRNGVQIAFSFLNADFDTIGKAGAGINVKPGDVIEVYIVDSLSNSGGSPTIL